MTKCEQQLLCIKCKTELAVKAYVSDEEVVYKLVICPKCHAPIRDVRSNKELSIKTI